MVIKNEYKYTVPLWQTGLLQKIRRGQFISLNFLKIADRAEKLRRIHKM